MRINLCVGHRRDISQLFLCRCTLCRNTLNGSGVRAVIRITAEFNHAPAGEPETPPASQARALRAGRKKLRAFCGLRLIAEPPADTHIIITRSAIQIPTEHACIRAISRIPAEFRYLLRHNNPVKLLKYLH